MIRSGLKSYRACRRRVGDALSARDYYGAIQMLIAIAYVLGITPFVVTHSAKGDAPQMPATVKPIHAEYDNACTTVHLNTLDPQGKQQQKRVCCGNSSKVLLSQPGMTTNRKLWHLIQIIIIQKECLAFSFSKYQIKSE
ncbi:GL20521 [Drosophila persimilis]|uniref:GL20521 n=1 Tax=Drosophila persimilis TaxID=7234 RepID=B4GJR2_DROPE|nr:GL20521 [Drosophila persimilis]